MLFIPDINEIRYFQNNHKSSLINIRLFKDHIFGRLRRIVYQVKNKIIVGHFITGLKLNNMF